MKESDTKCYTSVDLEKVVVWQTIGNDGPMTIPVNGYPAVYLSNATSFAQCEGCLNSEGDVYFDKLKIKFTRGNLKEETHYYPFGLPMAAIGSSAMGMTPNRQKYQSNEYITDAGLNWMSFGARQYDPQLGRFLSVDPMAAIGGQDMLSPYHAMGNDPVSGTDPGGMMPPGGPIGFKNPNIIPFLSPAGNGLGSPTNGYYTRGINLANFSSIGQWINTFGDGQKALAEAFGQTASDNYDATTGNNSDNTSKVAGNYSSGGGAGQSGSGIQTIVNADGETVAVNGSFNHEADADPSSVILSNTAVQGSYYNSGGIGSLSWNGLFSWNGPIARFFIDDSYTISIGGDVAGFLGFSQTTNFTLLTRGREAGSIVETSTLTLEAGGGVAASMGISVSSGHYTGDPSVISSSMLGGRSYGAIMEGGILAAFSLSGSISHPNEGGYFMTKSAGVGFGDGAFVGGQVQFTTTPTTIFKF